MQNLEKALANPSSEIEIKNTSPDQLAQDLTPAQRAALPVYNDELILKTHGTGCYTSQAAMKRSTARTSCWPTRPRRPASRRSGSPGEPYPTERLRDAWIAVPLAPVPRRPDRHVHSAGVSVLVERRAGVAQSVRGRADELDERGRRLLDTTGAGMPLVVYNPVSMDRREPVEATVQFPGAAPRPCASSTRRPGARCSSQVLGTSGSDARIVFLGDVPSIGYRVFHVTPAGRGRTAGEQAARRVACG